MRYTTQYISDMLTCAQSKLAAASYVTWRREYYGLYGLTDALCHVNQLILFIFLIKRWNNSPSAINASTEDDLSRIFDRIIRMPYPCALQQETVPEVTVNQPPIVDAGPDKNLSSLVTSTTLTGTVTTQDGDTFTVLWTKVSGGNATINAPTTVITSVTNMQQGTYIFQLTAMNSHGISSSDTVTITIAQSLDTIYWGRTDTPIPTDDLASFIAASGFVLQADGTNDVAVPWQNGAISPQYCWVAIPDRTPSHNKNHWFVDIINQGNIGLATDLFGASQTANVGGIDYLVWSSNYMTQFSQTCLLKKI